jgi:hypothetical protein
MFTNDNDPLQDLQNYENKERLLDVIRRKREQNNAASTDVGGNVWGTVRTDEVNSGTNGGAGGATSHQIYGGNGSAQDSQGSHSDFSEQLGRLRTSVAGSNSGAHQYERPTAKQSSWGDSLKNVGRQYKQIFTKAEKHTDAPTRIRSPKIEGKKLSDAEILRLRPKMVEYVLWQSEHLDQLIIATTVGHDPGIEIWGDITSDEAEIIVDYLLQRGKTDIRTAQAVRYASTLIDRLKLGLIISPRFYATAMIYIKRGFSIR